MLYPDKTLCTVSWSVHNTSNRSIDNDYSVIKTTIHTIKLLNWILMVSCFFPHCQLYSNQLRHAVSAYLIFPPLITETWKFINAACIKSYHECIPKFYFVTIVKWKYFGIKQIHFTDHTQSHSNILSHFQVDFYLQLNQVLRKHI